MLLWIYISAVVGALLGFILGYRLALADPTVDLNQCKWCVDAHKAQNHDELNSLGE